MKKLLFHKLFRKHQDSVFSYSFYFLKNRDDAEDVTQEVFIRLWQHWDEIDQKKVVAWMMKVAYHLCIDRIRQRKLCGNRFQDQTQNRFEKILTPPNVHTNPELGYEFNETQKVLLCALEILPERTRSILLLHYFQGLKYETIGEIMNLNVSAIKVAVHRGKKILRETIKKQYPELVES